MLQVHEEKGAESDAEELITRIYKVLYAKVDDDMVVTDEGELIEHIEDKEFNSDQDSVITMDDVVD